ncbi:MAG: restriction endonuclease subunit S [Veillonella sp.]|uniref:restriction endonuclease subunit S n=1 Tax=Veillonella sp. TaxID=1926307 RepID=UPI002579F0AF|nr:restriction endonuclease subunit S [Veillonella sp.]MBS5756067.1 restriction endonuclease subunit S [Veillonella sp.]
MGNKPRIRFKGFTEDWEQCKLGEFVNIVSGDAPSTFISGNCIYVKVDDLNYSDRIQLSSSNLVNANPKAHLVNTGATIFPKRGAAIMTNKVRIMGQDGYLDTNMMALIPKEIDKDFLFTFIQKTGLYKISDTSTIPQINNKHIEPYMIQVPTNKEQECIGVFFEKIDKIITLHQCKLEKLKLTKKALLQKLFPKNGKHIPEIRFKGFTDAWEQRKLNDFVIIRRGLTYKPSDIAENGIRVLRSSNIDEDQFITSNDDVFVNKDAVNIPFAKNGDILITSANGSNRLVGKHTIISDIAENSTVHGGFMLLAESKNPLFTDALLSSNWYKRFINTYVAGGNGAIGNLSKSDLENQTVVVPSEHEQAKIGQWYDNINQLITLHQRKLERLQEVKKGLLQKMFV